ncbi:MAG: hypothetical protein K8W52_09160 [Deltaproteobacteria bacterium]|nr:hypothetical protein [Deltaproteobacteria bacterium]
MKRSSPKKLSLSRSTIQTLVLSSVAGAAPNTYTLCTSLTVPSHLVCPSAPCSIGPGCTLYPCATTGTYG